MRKELLLFTAHLNSALRANTNIAVIRGTTKNLFWLRRLVRDGFILGFTPDLKVGFVKVFVRVSNQTTGIFSKLVQVSIPTNQAIVKSVNVVDPARVAYYSVLGGMRLGREVLNDTSGGVCSFRLKW